MARPARPWFRFYVEAFRDAKMRRLRPSQRWLWVAVLGAARESPEPGVLLIGDNLPMTVEELADYAAMTVREVTETLSDMRKLGLITIEGDRIEVPKFASRQFESDNVTARVRRSKERSYQRSYQRSKEHPNDGGGNVPDTETETDTEKPFAHSRSEEALEPLPEPDRFDEFWAVYDHKLDRKKAAQKFRLALKKPGVTADLLIDAASNYIAWKRSEGKHPTYTKNPVSWLNGECWADELPSTRTTPATREPSASRFLDIGEPPPNLGVEEYAAWHANALATAKRKAGIT